jgi:hypothetical protein
LEELEEEKRTMTLRKTSRSHMAQRDLIAWLAAGGLAGALSLGLPGTIRAQETGTARQQDTTQTAARAESTSSDSTKWGYSVERQPDEQNPQGYRGMERPSSLSDSGSVGDTLNPADATSRVNQMERQDSVKQPGENPPGYRGMERPAGLDSATKQSSDTGKTSRAAHNAHTDKQAAKSRNKSKKAAARDSSAQDSTKWGYKVDRKPETQNPAGYRGMERPSNVFPPDSARSDSGAPADATSRVNQMEREDSLQQNTHQNPPGYRGMERPAALDSAQQQSGNRDTLSRMARDTAEMNRGETRGKTTADSARFGVNAQEQSTRPGANRPDSSDIVHQQREVAPGMGHQPPPYPADSERVWVQQRPGNDSINVNGGASGDTTRVSQ